MTVTDEVKVLIYEVLLESVNELGGSTAAADLVNIFREKVKEL